MKMLLLLSLVALIVSSSAGHFPHIIGGSDVPYVGRWPWQGSLRNWLGNHKCGCALASANWVITAAHCIGGSEGNMVVILGAHDIKTLEEGEPITYSIAKKIVHTGFENSSPAGFPNDIGLLQLSEPAKLSSPFIEAVDLARPEDGDWAGWKPTCFISGWGDDGDWFLPNILQEAQVLALDEAFCQEIFGESRIGDGHICVAYNNKSSACSGDSGGPLVCLSDDDRWLLVGVTSWGKATCNPTYPSVYTRISHYRGWLTDNTKGEL